MLDSRFVVLDLHTVLSLVMTSYLGWNLSFQFFLWMQNPSKKGFMFTEIFGSCFWPSLVLWVWKAVKTTQLGRKSKTGVMEYVWRTQGHFWYGLAVDWHEANGLSITEIAVMAGTHWEPMRNTLCCPVFQSFLLLYLCRGASGKWSAYNYRCSTSH